jgi:xanthine/uracil permease
MYTVYLGILTGCVAAWAMGQDPGWPRIILATLLGLIVGVAADLFYPEFMGMKTAARDAWVAVPLFGPYGLSFDSFISIPLGLLGAAVAARRNYNRITSPNDLRR